MLIRHSLWCGREDSNLHRISPTSPSSWRVYHSATTAYSLFMAHHNEINGAGEENRTLTVSLEGWSSTIKLHPLIRMVGKTGFEPATPWSQTRCSTKLSHFPFFKMAVQTGIEPAISCVTGRHVNRYTTGPFGCGDRTWTCDLRVMSPTSYQLLHPAMLYLNLIWRRKRDSNPRDAFTPCRFSRPIPSAGLGYSSILSIFSLVAEEGLEPPTSRVWTVRSSQLSYSAFCCYFFIGGD